MGPAAPLVPTAPRGAHGAAVARWVGDGCPPFPSPHQTGLLHCGPLSVGAYTRMRLYAGVAVGSLVVGPVIERAAFRSGFAVAAAGLLVGPTPCPPCPWGTSTPSRNPGPSPPSWTTRAWIDAFRSANPTLPGPTVWQRVDAPPDGQASCGLSLRYSRSGGRGTGPFEPGRPQRAPAPAGWHGPVTVRSLRSPGRGGSVSLVGRMICAEACRLDQGPCAWAGGPGLIWTAMAIDKISDCVHN